MWEIGTEVLTAYAKRNNAIKFTVFMNLITITNNLNDQTYKHTFSELSELIKQVHHLFYANRD